MTLLSHSYGAALIVNNMAATALPRTFGHVQYNPLCVLRYEDPTLAPDEWENVSAINWRI